MNEKKVVISISVLVAVVFLAIYFYLPTKSNTPLPIVTDNQLATTTNEVVVNNLNSQGSNNSANIGFGTDTTVLDEEFLKTIPQPSITKEVIVTASMPDEAKKIIADKISKTRTAIQGDLYNLDLWIQLGIQYKVSGNLELAREVWEYVTKSNPRSLAAHSNLGDLYHYYLKDYIKAEYNLKKVIEIDPSYIVGYKNLSDLYLYSYKKETNEAAEVLRKGIEKNSLSVDLYMYLASYYMNKEANELARIELEKALTIAKKADNKAQISEINSLLSKLQ